MRYEVGDKIKYEVGDKIKIRSIGGICRDRTALLHRYNTDVFEITGTKVVSYLDREAYYIDVGFVVHPDEIVGLAINNNKLGKFPRR